MAKLSNTVLPMPNLIGSLAQVTASSANIMIRPLFLLAHFWPLHISAAKHVIYEFKNRKVDASFFT